MARYVVLAFEDNDEAEDFIEASDGKTSIIHKGEVVGLYAQPTLFCPGSNSGGCGKSKRVRGWVRGKKYGWWVCTTCKKPSNFRLSAETLMKNVIQHGELLLHRRTIPQATNLLTGETTEVATVNDPGWGAYREGVIR